MKRETAKLFPLGYWDAPLKTADQLRTEKRDALLRSAANLRTLAARGMSVIAFTKNAIRLEAEAARLAIAPLKEGEVSRG